jgi:hypothetical protein
MSWASARVWAPEWELELVLELAMALERELVPAWARVSATGLARVSEPAWVLVWASALGLV